MNRIYYRLFLLAVLGAIAALTGIPWMSAHAETEPTGFENVTLWLYPEYDDTRLLVMLEGDVEGVAVPATVRFLVPATAEMYSAGSMDELGHYSGGPPLRKPSSLAEWDEISYEVTTKTFRVEYYAPLIEGFPDKVILYESRFLYSISDLNVIIQEPYSSSNFSIIPAAESTFNDGDFENHRYTYRNLAKDDPIYFDISYTKQNTDPSLTIMEDTSSNAPVIAGTVIGLAILFTLGAYWVIRSRSKHRVAPRRVTAQNRGGKSKKRPVSRFCTQCRQALESSHRFCPYCGSKIS